LFVREEPEEELEEEEEEEEEQEQELEYRGSWGAVIINMRQELSGGQAGKWSQSYLSKELLQNWRYESYTAYLGNLSLSYQYTEAVITHEKCRLADQAKCDIKDGEALEGVYQLL